MSETSFGFSSYIQRKREASVSVLAESGYDVWVACATVFTLIREEIADIIRLFILRLRGAGNM